MPDDLIDYSPMLRFLCPELLAEGCHVVLDERQFDVLREVLVRVRDVGEIGFQLEACIDHRPGHTLSWDNAGTWEQDRQVDRLMDELAIKLFFQNP